MNRYATLTLTATALLCLAVDSSAGDSLTQQKSLKDQLVGAWTLVSSDQVRPGGSKLQQFGANPKGINVFDPNGRFFLMIATPGFLVVANAENPKVVAYDLSTMNSEKLDGLIAEPIVNRQRGGEVVIFRLEASTFPNQVGTEQKWTVTSLKSDELKYSNSGAMSGVEVHQVWKRAE